jgi:enediyne biosynthesis protein E4
MGPGCAFLDLTGDDLPDIYLLNGSALPGAPPGVTYGNRFYRNNGDGTFTDVTRSSGLKDGQYALGCCAGDYDNDGDTDLYVTHYGTCALFRNNGAGVFADVTQRAGVGARGFCAGASFADYDGDSYLDLYVCRYVKWTPETNIKCTQPAGQELVQGGCRPTVYPADRGVLYHNNGNGTFSDHTTKAGMTYSGPTWMRTAILISLWRTT